MPLCKVRLFPMLIAPLAGEARCDDALIESVRASVQMRWIHAVARMVALKWSHNEQ